MKARAVLVAVLFVSSASTVRAEDLTSAQEHFERGSTLFDIQRFAEAAHEYELSFESAPDPVMLFNIGQAYRLAGELGKASRAYKTYLARLPNARNAADVRRKINELDAAIAEQAKKPVDDSSVPATRVVSPPIQASSPVASPAAAPPVVSESQHRPWYRSRLGWALSLSGLAFLGAGIGFVVEGQNQADLVTSAPSLPERYEAADRARVFRPVGYAVLAAGGAALLGGVISFVLQRHTRRLALNAMPSPGSLFILAGGDW